MDRPAEGCQFRNLERPGQRAEGEIVNVDYEEEEVIVQYKGNNIEYQGNWHVRIDGILHHINHFIFHPEELYKGGDLESFGFDELNYDSREGGEGLWYYG